MIKNICQKKIFLLLKIIQITFFNVLGLQTNCTLIDLQLRLNSIHFYYMSQSPFLKTFVFFCSGKDSISYSKGSSQESIRSRTEALTNCVMRSFIRINKFKVRYIFYIFSFWIENYWLGYQSFSNILTKQSQ